MDSTPKEEEVLSAVVKMNNWRSGGDAKIPGEFYKALCKDYGKEDTPETTHVCVAALVSMYKDFWKTGHTLVRPRSADESVRKRRGTGKLCFVLVRR